MIRFNPESITLPRQYLALVGGECEWTEDRAAAAVFESHREAQAEAERHRFTAKWDESGREHKPWACVLENPALEAERQRRQADRAAQLEANVRHVAPEECYRRTAERMGELG